MTSRLALLPGLRILARGNDIAQIGLGPRHRLLVRLDPGMRRVLAALDRGETLPTDPSSRRATARLRPVLFDPGRLADPGIAPGSVAALAAADPHQHGRRLAARAQPVLVLDDLGTAVGTLLADSGVTVVAEHPDPAAAVLVTAGEPDRTRLDPWVRSGVPHLVVRAVENEFLIGPLVVPGSTACLRCLDAHRSAEDPQYPVLASIHHREARRDGLPEPVDPAVAAIAAGWAVRDLIAHLEGDRATSWSATVQLGLDPGGLCVLGWRRHPDCGCAWVPAGEDPSVTMAS